MMQRTYDLIVTWARAYGEPIPLDKLAGMLGIRSAQHYVHRLIAMGLITNEWGL